VASISVGRVGDTYRVIVRGRLRARDLRRLESASGAALQERVVPLELDVRHVSSIDDAAHAYLERLRLRGAHIRGSPRQAQS
jgi:hypothetical protein